MLQDLMHRLERNEDLDRLAEPIDRMSRPLLRRPPVSRALSGAWLGHRLHPVLTDVVIGAWLSAGILDAVGDARARKPSRTLIGVGIASSLPTVAAGVHDWLDYGPKVRRSGVVHALANAVGLALQMASWSARRSGAHRRGMWLSAAAMTASGVGAYIGGHLTYVLGAGVERTAFSSAPEEWTPAVPLAELEREGKQVVDVGGTPVLVLHDAGTVRALADTCNHAGCSLAEGEVADGVITCPCHGSRYRLRDGGTLAGPAAAAQPVFATRVRDGVVEVRESA